MIQTIYCILFEERNLQKINKKDSNSGAWETREETCGTF